MINAFSAASSQPWAIEPDALRTVLQVADRMGDPEALATRLGRPLENTQRAEFRGGVATIPIRGPLFRHAGLLTDVSGATATGTLALDFQAALDNKFVHTIVLDIDSPGGEMTGIQELADHIQSARTQKTIKAYIGGIGASAAYWLASATSQIIVAETAVIGSIGVVSTYIDTKQRDEKAGIRRIEIVSSSSPDKRLDPATEAGLARVQALVDGLGDIFVRAVARNRGVTTRKVLSDFGKGFVMTGADAVRVGMADGLGTLEGVVAGQLPRALDRATSQHVSVGTRTRSSGPIFEARKADVLRAANTYMPDAGAASRATRTRSSGPIFEARKADVLRAANTPTPTSAIDVFERRKRDADCL